jgi:hypothetical protein
MSAFGGKPDIEVKDFYFRYWHLADITQRAVARRVSGARSKNLPAAYLAPKRGRDHAVIANHGPL